MSFTPPILLTPAHFMPHEAEPLSSQPPPFCAGAFRSHERRGLQSNIIARPPRRWRIPLYEPQRNINSAVTSPITQQYVGYEEDGNAAQWQF